MTGTSRRPAFTWNFLLYKQGTRSGRRGAPEASCATLIALLCRLLWFFDDKCGFFSQKYLLSLLLLFAVDSGGPTPTPWKAKHSTLMLSGWNDAVHNVREVKIAIAAEPWGRIVYFRVIYSRKRWQFDRVKKGRCRSDTMLSYMIPVEDKPPPIVNKNHLQLELELQKQHNGVNGVMAPTTVQDFIEIEQIYANGNTRKTVKTHSKANPYPPMSTESSASSLSSKASDLASSASQGGGGTPTSLDKPKSKLVQNGGTKTASLKR